MKNKNKAYTLMELLIIIALLILFAFLAIVLINPYAQMQKGNDSKRKYEVSEMSRIFDEFFNDYGVYPDDSQACYNDASQENDVCACFICGADPASPSFHPYFSTLPCDPQHPAQNYLYEYQCSGKKWFKIYTKLYNSPVVQTNEYNFGLSSSNVSIDIYPTLAPPPTAGPSPTTGPSPLPTPIICSGTIYCYKGGNCNVCEPGPEGCFAGPCDEPVILFDDGDLSGCHNECIK